MGGGGIFIDKNVAFLMKLMGQSRAMDHLLVMSEKVCKILLVLAPMLGVPQA